MDWHVLLRLYVDVLTLSSSFLPRREEFPPAPAKTSVMRPRLVSAKETERAR